MQFVLDDTEKKRRLGPFGSVALALMNQSLGICPESGNEAQSLRCVFLAGCMYTKFNRKFFKKFVMDYSLMIALTFAKTLRVTVSGAFSANRIPLSLKSIIFTW
jgi:hypothetical protein